MRRIFTLFAALLLAACNPFAVMDGADAEIAAFHTAFNASEWETIWNDADEEFRTVTPLAGFDTKMSGMREAMGEWQSGEQTGFEINTDNGRTTTQVTYSSTFANGTATETFLFVGEGEEMVLLGWEIAPLTDAAGEAPATDAAATDGAEKPAAPADAASSPAGEKPAAPTQADPEAAPPKPVD